MKRLNFKLALVFAVANVGAGLPSTACAQTLQDLYRLTDAVSRPHVEYRRMEIPKGHETVLADLQGPGKIAYWYITDDTGGKFAPGLVLRVFWDGETEASINVPLSDFFGAIAGHTIDYQSVPMQINHLCYMCYVPMPFSARARFVLANDGDRDYSQSMAYGVDWERSPQYAAEKSRLHCAWRRSNPVQDGAAPLDRSVKASQVGGKNTFNTRHTVLEVKGRGHYIGNFLQVYTRSPNWWGEGVTFFHLDGETLVHSPGTEDEYGACWGFGGTFAYPYCGYLQHEKGQNRMYRWYVTNPVRFRESLKVEIQSILVPDNAPFQPGADDFTSVAYWYQEEPHQAFALQLFAERTARSRAAEFKLPKVEGTLEGEELKILATSGGRAKPQRGRWSGGAQLWWSQGKPGDKLDLAVPVSKAGKYKLIVELTKAVDYGMVQLYFDDRKLGDVVDLYHPSVVSAGPMTFEMHDLSAGEHKLTLEITGSNPAAVKAYMVSLDYVKLEPMP